MQDKICHADSDVVVSCDPKLRSLVARALQGLAVPHFASREGTEAHAVAHAALLQGYRTALADVAELAEALNAATELVQDSRSWYDQITEPQRRRALQELVLRLRTRITSP